jgi:hypothetical protein
MKRRTVVLALSLVLVLAAWTDVPAGKGAKGVAKQKVLKMDTPAAGSMPPQSGIFGSGASASGSAFNPFADYSGQPFGNAFGLMPGQIPYGDQMSLPLQFGLFPGLADQIPSLAGLPAMPSGPGRPASVMPGQYGPDLNAATISFDPTKDLYEQLRSFLSMRNGNAPVPGRYGPVPNLFTASDDLLQPAVSRYGPEVQPVVLGSGLRSLALLAPARTQTLMGATGSQPMGMESSAFSSQFGMIPMDAMGGLPSSSGFSGWTTSPATGFNSVAAPAAPPQSQPPAPGGSLWSSQAQASPVPGRRGSQGVAVNPYQEYMKGPSVSLWGR